MKLHGVVKTDFEFDYSVLKKNRDTYIERLRSFYHSLYEKIDLDFYKGFAKFLDANRIQVGENILEGEKILIATGSHPVMDQKIEGIEHCLNSDHFFDLKNLPKKALVLGGGYIALELAQIM